jgi:hypothetical protein
VYNRCTLVTRECSTGSDTCGRLLRHLDDRRVLQAKRNKGMYQNNKTWFAASVWSVVTVVSVESEGFRSF